ncbi:MAG: MBL fold metallo-hydrolase [Pseudomonadota bacterium]
MSTVTSPTASHTVCVGQITLTQLKDGSVHHAPSQAFFGINAEPGDFRAVCADNALDPGGFDFPVTVTLVETAGHRVLVDAGFGPAQHPVAGQLHASLLANGIPADSIDTVLISHLHRDHVGGLLDDRGGISFPAARHLITQAEIDYWLSETAEPGLCALAERLVETLGDRLQVCAPGDEVAPGVTVLDGAGHTPGHVCVLIESDGSAALVMSDLANHAIWSMAHPDWYMSLDVDPLEAARVRRELLDFASDRHLLIAGYHLPFPALGYVSRDGDGFCYEPLAAD